MITTSASNAGIAVIGAGHWGKNLVRNFSQLGVLKTVCDLEPRNLEPVADAHSREIAITSDYGAVLSDDAITAVAIATPATTHAGFVERALKAGKDVYVEKPLCLDEAQGEGLNGLALASNKLLMVGHLLWYHPAVLKLKSIVDKGILGRVQYIYSNRLNMGKLRREENVLWSFAPHDVSVILGLLGEMPESVSAQGGNYLHQRIADTTVTLLNFASGVRAHIFVSWLHPFKEQKLVVVGDRGMAVFDDGLPWMDKLRVFPHSVEWSENIPIAHKAEAENIEVAEDEPLKAECWHFLECIESRAAPRTDGKEGLRVLRVLNACQRSLETESAAIRLAHETTIQDYSAHSTAHIDSDVEIGRDTKVWHFSHVLSGSRIGARCNIGQNVVIGPEVQIGNGCRIQNNVSVYKGVTLEDDVFCGPSMVFTNVFNPRAAISRKSEYRNTLVKKGVTIGANATILCGHTLGRYAFIGAGAVVTRDVPDHALVLGNPARQIGWMCGCGERLNSELACVDCGNRYMESIDGIAEVPA